MQCARCGTGNPDNARFCSNCGLPFAQPPAQPGRSAPAGTAEPAGFIERPRVPVAPKKSIWPYLAIAIAAALVATGFAIVRALNSSGKVAQAPNGAPIGGQVAQSPNLPNTGRPFTQSPQVPGANPGLTQGPQNPGLEQPPPGTNDYLKWLRQKEQERQNLYAQMQDAIQKVAMQAGLEWAKGMGALTEPGGMGDVEEPAQNIQKQASALDVEIAKLQTLGDEVMRKVPPDSCRPLHEQYNTMVQKWLGAMKQTVRAIDNADFTDIPAGGMSDRQIEDALRNSEQELAGLYSRYAITDPPQFHIEDRGASGGGGPFSSGR